MLPKLTIEEFYKIKERLKNKMEELQKKIEEVYSTLSEDEELEFQINLVKEYETVQKELLKYDLSDIPFDAWEGIALMSTEDLDLSPTHANIDFSIVEVGIQGDIILKGCKVRNLDRYFGNIKEENVDQEIIDSFPNIFLSKIFPQEFRSKFLSKTLTFADLKTLNEDQIAELKDKDLNIAMKGLESHRDKMLLTVARYIPLNKLISLLNQDEEFLKDAAIVADFVNTHLGYIPEDNEVVKLLIEENNLETIKTKVDELFEERVLPPAPDSLYFHHAVLELEQYSDNFKKRHPNAFPNMDNCPEELQRKLVEKKLTIEDLIIYSKSLEGLNVYHYMDRQNISYKTSRIIKILGEHLGFLAASFPSVFKEIEKILETSSHSVFSIFERIYTRQISQIKKAGSEAIKHLFMTSILTAYYGENNSYIFSPNATPDIYEETRYPEWMKEAGYYVSKVIGVYDNYSTPIEDISSKTIIEDEKLKLLFDTFGFENIKRLDKSNYFFTTRIIGYLVETITELNLEPAKDYEDFKKKLIYAIFHAESYRKKELLGSLKYVKKDFIDNPESYMISEDAPEELITWYNNGDYNLRNVLANEEWLPYILKLDLLQIGAYYKINSYNSEHVPAIPMELNFVELFLQENSQEELLDFLLKYRDYLIQTGNMYLLDISVLSKEGIEKAFMQALEREIVGKNRAKISENSPEEFKNRYPYFFIGDNAPQELKYEFYNRYLSLDSIRKHPEWIPYLEHVNLELIDRLHIRAKVAIQDKTTGVYEDHDISQIYIDLYGLKAYLEYIIQYPQVFSQLAHSPAFPLKDISKESLEHTMEDIYKYAIEEKGLCYKEDMPQEFKTRFPELFLPTEAPEGLKKAYYERRLKFVDIRKNPEYIQYMHNINISTSFSDRFTLWLDDIYSAPTMTIKEVMKYVTKEEFLTLLSLYGEYLAYLRVKVDVFEANINGFEELKALLEVLIIQELQKPGAPSNFLRYQEDAPDFIKKRLPDYFLDPNAPQELKDYYYQIDDHHVMTFDILGEHKEWHPYLKDKNLIAALRKLNDITRVNNSVKYIELFGQENALKYSAQRKETVNKMIRLRKVELMHEWWLKTGKKFIPDYTIMTLFSIEDADKFLAHGKEWSTLMRNKRFSTTQEGKEAMIKLAYSFGVFDDDQQGAKKLDSLLNDIPKKLIGSDMDILLEAEQNINNSNSQEIKPGIEDYQQLRETLASEGLVITSDSIFRELYRANEDVTYTLTINTQEYPKSRELLRSFMEKNNLTTVISVAKAHTIFGAFDLIYDRDFREFLLKNLDLFLTTPDYLKYISSIQKQFQLIKVFNSNRVLTPELAVSFVQENKYENIEVGNEELARVSGIAGYSQQDFDKLQRIYNYGKTRVTSSIPRVVGKVEDYSYEILRLTDPLAVAVGTLSDCCQELDNVAEVCMIHSMVDQHGRVFVIRDEEGNIVAQSWVWRNKDVLCFDNIEIPDKVFDRARRQEKPMSRGEVAEKVYRVYKVAAKELMEADERVYKELLEAGKITQEQYDSLRLGKVTVGLGYNDIAEALKNNAPMDSGKISKPLAFESPIESERGLYISDSSTQRILEEREDRVIPSETSSTITAHYDEYEIYDKTNINFDTIYVMNRLEALAGRYSYQMNTQVEDVSNSQTIMEELSYNYGTNVDNTKVIINPHFCIVYEETQNEIRIVDSLSVLTKTGQTLTDSTREKVSLQIKLAIIQLLKSGKEINIESLGRREKEVLTSILEIPDSELEKERGVSYGTN